MMQCQCRNCGKSYEMTTSRAKFHGYCSQKCVHIKTKQLGYKKGNLASEYTILALSKEIGHITVKSETIKWFEAIVQTEIPQLLKTPTKPSKVMQLILDYMKMVDCDMSEAIGHILTSLRQIADGHELDFENLDNKSREAFFLLKGK